MQPKIEAEIAFFIGKNSVVKSLRGLNLLIA
jgi:hypothetical protein